MPYASSYHGGTDWPARAFLIARLNFCSVFSYVCILRSVFDGKFYVGYTNNLRRRLREHNAGASFATRLRVPLRLIYYEAHLNRQDAERREQFFKTGWGRRYIKRVLYYYLRAKI